MDLLVPEVISLISKLGGQDGAYKGRIHVIVPFIGRKNGTLTARQQSYNDVHGWYRARIEQLFARLWHWGLFWNIWRGDPNELHQSVRILLHFTRFCIRRQVRYPPLLDHGSMSRLMFGLTKATRPPQDEAEDEVEVCVLCCHKRSTITVCGECGEYFAACIDTHTCGTHVVCYVQYKGHLELLNSQLLPYYATCFVGKTCSPTWSIWGAST